MEIWKQFLEKMHDMIEREHPSACHYLSQVGLNLKNKASNDKAIEDI